VVGFEAGHWYQVRLGLHGGLAQVWIDGELQLSCRVPTLGQGKVGLLAEAESGIFFDDVLVRPWSMIYEDFSDRDASRWTLLSGKWTWLQSGAVEVACDGQFIAVAGSPQWSDYRCQVQVNSNIGGLGIVFGYRSPGEYCLFRWASANSSLGYAGKAQIVCISDGKRSVVAEQPLAKSEVNVAQVILRQGLVRGLLDGDCVVEVWQPSLVGPGVGLYADGARGAVFSGVYAEQLPPPRTVHVVKEFADVASHGEMAEWSSPRGIWVTPEDEKAPEAQWRSKGVYFGDEQVRFTLNDIGAKAGTLLLTLHANPDEDVPGYALRISAAAGSNTLEVALLSGDRQLGQSSVEVSGDSCQVQFSHLGDWLVAIFNDHCIFQEEVK